MYTIDATNKKLGRIATEAANVLRGKNSPNYEPRTAGTEVVHIVNASKIDLSPERMEETYRTHSHRPGSEQKETRKHLLDRKGYEEIFRKTIYGMIPANKHRAKIMKNLKITD